MDMRKIERLLKMVDKSTVSEIEIKDGDNTIRVSRTSSIVSAPAQQIVQTPVMQTSSETPIIPQSMPPAAQGSEDIIDESSVQRSPMVGTFYSAASPESNDFVKVGDNVNVGDTLCIIEAMKIMNQIEAEKSGVITEINLSSGEPVEYNQPLFVIK
jgi:acetyl-CoA carboxylase biotin carboxyl carrier protein